MKKIMIVMPVGNEEGSIEKTLKDILDLNIPDLGIVPVMDGYSTDRTKELIERMQQSRPAIQLLYYKQSTGGVSCYLYGFKYALSKKADYVIEMDAGGSHDPKEIPNFIKYLDAGYDCVFSSRFMKGSNIENHPLYRILISRYGTILANAVLGTRLTDMTSGYEAFRREVLEQVDLDKFLSANMSHFYQTEMRYYCSEFRTYEIPITYKGSSSKLKFKTILKSVMILFVLKIKRKRGSR